MHCNPATVASEVFEFRARLMILLRVGNRNFCFGNNSGAFLNTMKMAI